MRYTSPLRYPGGKTALTTFLARTIELNGLIGCHYVEPFAGGAGAALQLLFSGLVSSIHVNDKDPCIHSFWRAVTEESEAFLKLLWDTPVTIAEWKRQRAVLRDPAQASLLELGFATFFVNRCSHSGVLNGGPIGGLNQSGDYKIDARFYRAELARRIQSIVLYKTSIRISHQEGVDFLRAAFASAQSRDKQTLVYMDPPYFKKGHRLYAFYFDDNDHKDLAAFLHSHPQTPLHWVLSCDDAALIRRLYPGRLRSIRLKYCLRSAKLGRELVISSDNCVLPRRLQRFTTANPPRLEFCHGLP